MSAPDTPWRQVETTAGGLDGLVFGRMFEDWTIEAALFPRGGRVFAIASAGCTSLGLAALGHDVTAVDINGAQVELLRRRATGEPTRDGRVDRMLGYGRRGFQLLGWSDFTVRVFADLDDPAEQEAFWRARLDTRRWRAALAALMNPVLLRLFFPGALVRFVPRGFSKTIRSLSNIVDGVGTAYARRLAAAVDRAAAPGAVIVTRSFSEPQTADEETWARRDRGLLWGRVRVERRPTLR